MRGTALGLVGTLALAVAGAGSVGAVVLGGGPEGTDCYVTFEGISATNGRVVECRDGSACDADGQADNRCTFAVSVCVLQESAGCNPTGITVNKIKGAGNMLPNRPTLPASAAACGAPNDVVVRLKNNGQKPGKRPIRTRTITTGNPKTDGDRFLLRCLGSASGALIDGAN